MEYQSQTKNCQNCKKGFIIDPEDFLFYEKIKVPAPTWCPECRMIRRFSFYNVWNVFWRNCDKCGNKVLSMFVPGSDIVVYCSSCWWGDDWDGTEYGIDYDPAVPFLEQVKILIDKTPYVSVNNMDSTLKNCNYMNASSYSKDCYLSFWVDYSENVYNSTIINNLKYSLDCIRAFDSELCCGSVGLNRCYQTFYSNECDDCINVWFSRNCYNCQNCIGCVNLSGASYCIFNIKYSKSEYEEIVKTLNLKSWSKIQELRDKALSFWLTKPYRIFHGHSLNYNVTGDYIYNSKNSKESYILSGSDDCKYCQLVTVVPARDCYDYSGWGLNANRVYEGNIIGGNADSVYFSNECWPDVMDLQYCSWVISGKNNFGCVNLKRKQYCILNKQYTKEEFFKLREKIIEDMKVNPYIDKLGRKFCYGEFFPLEFSKFPYNKSNAMRFFKKTKEEALEQGFSWDDNEKPLGQSTIKAKDLTDKIDEVNDEILKESIECMNCKRAYNIAKIELDLLKRLELPLPRICPKCRENENFGRMTMPKFYNRKCFKCGEESRSPYSPDRPEIVYCEKCYQQEVY